MLNTKNNNDMSLIKTFETATTKQELFTIGASASGWSHKLLKRTYLNGVLTSEVRYRGNVTQDTDGTTRVQIGGSYKTKVFNV